MSQLNNVAAMEAAACQTAAMEAAACQTATAAMDLQCQKLLHVLEQASAAACAGEGEGLDPALVLGAVAGSARLTEAVRLAKLGCGHHGRCRGRVPGPAGGAGAARIAAGGDGRGRGGTGAAAAGAAGRPGKGGEGRGEGR